MSLKEVVMRLNPFVFSLIFLTIGNKSFSQDLGRKVESIFTRYADSGFAGSVLVSEKGNVSLKKSYGYANRSTRKLNSPSSIFNAASIGKQFTAYAILLLEKQKKLSTNDYVAKFIKHFKDGRDSMKIHHLLSHTSGMTREGTMLDYTTREKFIKSVKDSAMESIPGQAYRYSNAGYSMLAAIVEIASGMPFEDYLLQYIFRPLRMDDTGFPWERRINGDRRAIGYNNKGEPQPSQQNVWAARGAGNIVTSVEDLYKWIKALEDTTFFPRSFRNKIFFDHQPGRESYSWNKAKTSTGKNLYHKGGGRPDFESQILYIPDDQIVIIFLINNDTNLRRRITAEINRLL